MKEKVSGTMNSKADIREVDKLVGMIGLKVDTETVNELLHISKADIDEAFESFSEQAISAQRKFEDLIFEKA
jgi:hypothetical protein